MPTRLDGINGSMHRCAALPLDAGLAYLSLSCQARAVLIEIARGHDGINNGRLGLSIRRASERCNIARGTAQRAFAELQERGFIDSITKGAFSRKALHASEWRLTWWSCDVTGELPSKKFMSWGREKQNAVSKCPVAVSNQSHPEHEIRRKEPHGALD